MLSQTSCFSSHSQWSLCPRVRKKQSYLQAKYRGALEKGISADQDMPVLNIIGAASLCVAGSKDGLHRKSGHSDLLIILQIKIGGYSAGTSGHLGLVEPGGFTETFLMNACVNRCAGALFKRFNTKDMIEMSMCQKNRFYLQTALVQLLIEPVAQVSRVKDDRLIAAFPMSRQQNSLL